MTGMAVVLLTLSVRHGRARPLLLIVLPSAPWTPLRSFHVIPRWRSISLFGTGSGALGDESDVPVGVPIVGIDHALCHGQVVVPPSQIRTAQHAVRWHLGRVPPAVPCDVLEKVRLLVGVQFKGYLHADASLST